MSYDATCRGAHGGINIQSSLFPARTACTPWDPLPPAISLAFLPFRKGYATTSQVTTRHLSALEFTNDKKFINISIQKFTMTTDTLYDDDTFVFLVAKAALPAGEDGMLDSIYCTPFIPLQRVLDRATPLALPTPHLFPEQSATPTPLVHSILLSHHLRVCP